MCCQRSRWPPGDLCTVDRRCPACDRLVCAQTHMCWCSIPKCGQEEKNKKQNLQQWLCIYSHKHITIWQHFSTTSRLFDFWPVLVFILEISALKLCLYSNIIQLNDSWLDVGSFMQEQFSFLTKVKLTAAQKDVFTQDMSFILMTGPDVSIETSQLRSLASHQSADLHLVPFADRAAPWVTESWLLERGIAVDLLNVLEQVQFRPIMFDKWQKSLNIWANYDKEITKVSWKYVDSWFGNMEKKYGCYFYEIIPPT